MSAGAAEPVVVQLSGDLDMAAVDGAEARLRAALATEPGRLVVDLSAVTFLDSSGIRLLLRADELARKSGVELAITRPPDGVWRLLERFRLDTRLPFEPAHAAPAAPAAPSGPAGDGARDLRMELAADTLAPGLARQAVTSVTAELPDPVRDVALLLVSEVVTNAIRHGCEDPGDRVLLSLAHGSTSIRIEVEDPGPGIPAGVIGDGGDPLRESGWGLVMVDRFASRWGTELAPSRVWFELDLDG